MKNSITTLIILISLNLYCQNETLGIKAKNNIFNASKIEENHVLVNEFFEKLNFQIFEEIELSEKLKEYPIAEKKFVLNQKTTPLFSETIQKNIIEENTPLKESFFIEINEEFIDNVIVKLFIDDDKIQEIISNDAKNYGDRNIKIYRNYDDLQNKLVVTYKLNNSNSIQIGNSIFPYLIKQLKTDVEKTLNTSLNLLAVNF